MLEALKCKPEAADAPPCPRRLPIGAEVMPGGAHFRVWTPRRQKVEVIFAADSPAGPVELTPQADGYFAGWMPGAAAGQRYQFRLDGGNELLPDPASRYQPLGPSGPSELIDPANFPWTDHGWPGSRMQGQVIYETHIGTFTPEGTWAAAERELPALAELGITLLELMPVAAAAGSFGWSYDGVNLFAPSHWYGRPDDFRRFVNAAHAAGIGVVLDVVYNHVGIWQNTLPQFSPDYFTDRYKNEWGSAINFDGPGSESVREFMLANVRYWIDEFHLDGFRIDATQAFFDSSPRHILTEIAETARHAAEPRSVVVIGESEPQNAALVHSVSRGGHGMDALWNDDFHHSAMVRLTGRNEAYYTDYRGVAEEFLAAIRWGFLFQGQYYTWQEKPRGRPAFDLEPWKFVNYLQNHDQLANSARGDRVHRMTSPGRFRAMTALFLLAPQTPLLFQGQEFGASTPFQYFNNGEPQPGTKVVDGRKKFLQQFRSLALPEIQCRLADPRETNTFERCKLNFSERETHAEIYRLHRDLLRLRKTDPVISRQDDKRIHGATLSEESLIVRYFGEAQDDRLLLINFGCQLHYSPCPQPLLAPPPDKRWQVLWSSENPDYGGDGTPPLDDGPGWQVPGEAAVLLQPV